MKEVEDSRSPQAKPGPTGVPGFACGKTFVFAHATRNLYFFTLYRGMNGRRIGTVRTYF